MDIGEIIDQYHRQLFKLCLFYLKDKDEAEDILQEIFIKVLKKRASFKGEAGVYTWLYRIAVNTLINYINRKKIVQFISWESAPETVSPEDEPAARLETEELENRRLNVLETCLVKLSNREKTALYLFHYENMKQKEISGIMNTSVPAVESLVHKAMKKLKKCVKSPD